MDRKLEPPPISLPIYQGGAMTSDWHRWFQDVAMKITAVEATASAAGGPTGEIGAGLDGGAPDTDFTAGAVLDFGGPV